MRSFFIKVINDNISTYEYINNEFSILRNKGEEEQPFDYESFWTWWIYKNEYKEEEVSFLIMTDQDNFNIPNYISISKKNILSKKIITKKLEINFSKLRVINYPSLEEKIVENESKVNKKSIKVDEVIYKKIISPFMKIANIFFQKREEKNRKKKEKRDKEIEELKLKSERRL